MSLTCTAYRYSAVLLLALFSLNVNAQNLLPNPGFEDLNTCSEYETGCGIEAWFYIPTKGVLVKNDVYPEGKNGYNFLFVPVENIIEPVKNRSVVYTMLCCPLIEHKKYTLRFYLNTAGRKFYHLDFYFSEKDPNVFGFSVLKAAPSFSIEKNNYKAKGKEWKQVEYEFTANGNERYMVIGNFSTERMDYKPKDLMNKRGDVYYCVDDISLEPTDSMPLCAEYNANLEKLYSQNYRHTDFVLIDKEPEPVVKQPVFIKDTLTIPAVFFETNSALIKPFFQKKMDSITNSIREKKIFRIDINGHTDNKGTTARNSNLSLERAAAVKYYFVQKFPQYTDSVFVSGKGEEQPISTNETDEGRTKNRRVEIILTILDETLQKVNGN